MKTKLALVVVMLGVIAALLGACAQSANAIPATKRTITMTAVEPKGGVVVAQEAFPKDALPAGGGYLLKAPDKDGRWEVSAYRWDPNQVIVNQGDEVTLEILGINGAEHPSVIEGYNVTFNVKRGQVSKVTFKADKAGVFKINCGSHQPSMVGELIVLPR
ncbi:MAG: cupredoxin domain-containing protein [Chloroflexi bacterium]|nr:cupredoxin domain-containing protein [Chloroflexota bacterium]